MQLNNLNQADFFTAAASAFTDAASSGSSGGSPGSSPSGQPSGNNVSPALQTQISPQISPVFQQSFQPKNSPMTAGTQQLAPSTQSQRPASYPGEGNNLPGDPILPGSTLPVNFPTPLDFTKVNQNVTPFDYTKWGLIALGVVALGLITTNKKVRRKVKNYRVKRKLKRRRKK